ncbi:hypothetical protein [Erythrobacter sp. THAF29]|uniref:hypothetical protein n=1 Tax=Erythrobacter sp. THAF29 TaxID=2587851 RepID=UPI0012692B1B|nr:hypothetical protein [Erythrobacter sp. THAF29]QFT76001.1 hypothetical protein FIU90_00460 [Erythrobacter sp. THAF29]
MKKFIPSCGVVLLVAAGSLSAQEQAVDATTVTAATEQVETSVGTAVPAAVATTVTLPKDTLIKVSPVAEITSKKMKEGTTREFRVAEEIRRDGVTIVPLNAPVVATVSWRTGKGIFGKSAKFELTFTSIVLDGKTYDLTGTHRQEGRGNTAAALLVSGIITGRSAVMVPDQVVNARTAEDITIVAS